MTARDYEAEAVDCLTIADAITQNQHPEYVMRRYVEAQVLATLEVAKQVRRVADAMERDMAVAHKALTEGLDERTPLDVALIERAELVLKDLLDYPGLRLHVGNLLARRAEACLAELRRWKEQQP